MGSQVGFDRIRLPSSTFLFSVYFRVRVYSWKKHSPLAILKYHTEGVYSLDFSPMSTPGGTLLASASKDKKIAVWSLYNK